MKIRWENSYKMLERVWKLKKTIWKWIKSKSNNWFQNLFIQNNEWKKVINILKIFKFFYKLCHCSDYFNRCSNLINWSVFRNFFNLFFFQQSCIVELRLIYYSREKIFSYQLKLESIFTLYKKMHSAHKATNCDDEIRKNEQQESE